MKCKKCGADIPSGSRFCLKCGTPVQQKSFKKVFLIAACILLAVVCVGGAIALLPKKSKKKAAGGSTEDNNPYTKNPVMITWKESGLEDHPMNFETDAAKNEVYHAMEQTYGENKVDRNKEIMLSDCYELTKFYFSGGSSQADFEKICEIENIQDLNFSGTELTDISAISNLKYLKRLDLSRCGIKDISPISSLTELVALYLRCDCVEDYSPLLSLDKLSTLELSEMETPVDTDVLSQMNQLEWVDLDKCGLDDLEFLRGYSDLMDLSVTENNISDLSPLADKDKLQSIYFDYNNVSDITPLENKSRLAIVEFGYNHVKDISPLKDCPLVSLIAAHNGVEDISILKGITKIRALDLSGNNITDVSDLAYFEHLNNLYLENNNISDISPLIENEHLNSLNISCNALEGDLNIFGKKLIHLSYLDIAGNNITSFDGIENLPALATIRFDNPDIDVDPLLECDKLSLIEYSEDTPEDVKEKLNNSGKNTWTYTPDTDKYTIKLEDAGPNTVMVIKEVREITGLGLAETKALVESAPTEIDTYDYETASSLVSALKDLEAVVSLDIDREIR